MRLNHSLVAHRLFPALVAVLVLVRLISAQVPIPPGAVKAPATPASPGLGAPIAAAVSHAESSDDPLGRGTPRGTVIGFIKAAANGDYDTAVQYLDTRQHGDLARKLAQQLKDVLDRGASIDLARLSRNPEGSLANPQQPNREQIGSTSSGTGKLSILLERVTRGDEPPIWLFSSATLQQIPDAYDNLAEPSEVEKNLPSLLQTHFLFISISRWLLLFIAIPAVFFLASWTSKLLGPVLRTLAQRIGGDKAAE